MGALPRPDVPPGPHRDLVDTLHAMHHQAGWPSLRRMAARVGCSHTTVSHVFSSPRLPGWGVLELVAEALDGDVSVLRRLWLEASAADGRTGAGEAPRIAGRASELDVVRRHAEAGRGLLLVLGEAGMGKSRLVECACVLAARPRILTGICLPLSREVPLLPVADVLRSAYDDDEGRWVGEALRSCPDYVPASVVRLLPEASGLAPLPDPDDEWSRQRLYTAVGALLSSLARLRPLAVVLEDLHWADGATLDLVESLLARSPHFPAVATWRTDDPDVPAEREAWLHRVRRTPGTDALVLDPLDRAGTAEQLALVCGSVPAAVVDRVHARSRGLPLFTEQLAVQEQDDAPMPRVLEDVLVSRVSRLPDPSWRVVRALGVAARGLAEDAVAVVTGLAEEPLTDALHDLRDRRLLRADHRSGTVELRHPLLAEAVQRMLLPAEARTEHARLAQALASGSDVRAAEVAAHWQEADDPEHELPWRIRAAREAGVRFAPAQEADQWLRALELWPEQLEEAGEPAVSRVRASFNAMYALESSSQTIRAAALADAMMQHEDELDPRDHAELLFLAADYAGVLDDAERALHLAERGVALLEAQPPGTAIISALRSRAWLRQDLGQWHAAMADVERALEVNAEVGDVLQQRRLLATQGWFDFALGRRERGLERIADAAAIREVPDPQGDSYIAMVHSDLLLEVGAPAAAVAASTADALRAADELGIDGQLVSTARSNTAEAWLLAGDVERAQRVIGGRTDGEFRHERWALYLTQAEVEIARGRLDVAAAHLDRIAAHRLGAHAQHDYLAEVRTKLLLWQGRPTEAWSCAREVLQRWAAGGEQGQVAQLTALAARAAADAAQVGAATDDPLAELTDLVAAVRRATAGTGPADSLHDALRTTYDAEVGRAAGTGSADQWITAASGFDRVGRPHAAAYCRWRAAQCALSAGLGVAASRILGRAQRDARQHVPLTAAIRVTAARAGQ